jgi:beta-glucosidase/6-phospho-beta-glucosidase/beta-galactosidase
MGGAPNIRAPGPFLWGVATSAYQSEGGYNGPGQPRTNWADFEARGAVAPAGAAAEFWRRFPEDFAACRRMGLNAFRLGIEWTRVEPAPGCPDETALDTYAAMLDTCRQEGLEPVVTLHHFVHPAWLGTDPWLDPETPGRFAAHVSRLLAALAMRGVVLPRRWITVNEPNMLVLNTYFGNQFPGKGGVGPGPALRAYSNLLTAHVAAYNAIHDYFEARGGEPPLVTMNNYCSDLYWSDKVLLDLLTAAERGVPRDRVGSDIRGRAVAFDAAFEVARLPLHRDLPFYLGSAVKRASRWAGRRWFDERHLAGFLDALYRSPRKRVLDLIGIDYYDPFSAHAFRLPVFWDHEFKNRSLRTWVMNTITSKWWDWRVLPRGLHFFCRHYAAEYGRPVLIAENGLALRRRRDNTHTPRRDRVTRSGFLKLHIHEVTKIRKEGIPLDGYLHWSLFDNYEWGSFTPRFGLFSLDYTRGADRLVEDHHGDRPSETFARLIQEAEEQARSAEP